MVDHDGEDAFLHQGCSDAAGEIVEEEFRSAEQALHGDAEHEEGEHVEEQVPEIGMDKHVCHQLGGDELL